MCVESADSLSEQRDEERNFVALKGAWLGSGVLLYNARFGENGKWMLVHANLAPVPDLSKKAGGNLIRFRPRRKCQIMANAQVILDAFRDNPRTKRPALLVRDDGSENCVTITEFTQGGFRLAVSLRPKLGEQVLIRVTGHRDLPGRICWSHGTEAGGSY